MLYIYILKKRKEYKKEKYLTPYHGIFFTAKNDEVAGKELEKMPPFKYYDRFQRFRTKLLPFLFYILGPFNKYNLPEKPKK